MTIYLTVPLRRQTCVLMNDNYVSEYNKDNCRFRMHYGG